MAVAHTVPASIGVAPASQFKSLKKPTITRTVGGRIFSRTTGRRYARSYTLTPPLLGSADYLLWEQFLFNVMRDGGICWVPDPVSRTHEDVLCHPFPDGTRTTFSTNIIGIDGSTAMVDGVPTTATGHAAANLLSDNAALPLSASYFKSGRSAGTAPAYSIDSSLAYDGRSCLLCDPAADSQEASIGVANTERASVSASTDYTAMVVGKTTEAISLETRMVYFDSTPTLISAAAGTPVACTAGEWTHLTQAFTTPASTAYVQPYLRIDGVATSQKDFWCGLYGIAPGDYDVWHLPSQSPSLIEFSSAPAAGSVVTCHGTGQLLVRCMIQPTNSWTHEQGGLRSVQGVVAIESPEA